MNDDKERERKKEGKSTRREGRSVIPSVAKTERS